MPGIYEHWITVTLNSTQLAKVNLNFPAPYNVVTDEITSMIDSVRENMNYGITERIIPTLAEYSENYQKMALKETDSIITGKLENSINIRSRTGHAARVGTNLFYAEYVNDGRGPVVAKNKKCLHFITKTGDEVFTKRVGPAKPREYLERSATKLETRIDEVVNSTIDVVLNG